MLAPQERGRQLGTRWQKPGPRRLTSRLNIGRESQGVAGSVQEGRDSKPQRQRTNGKSNTKSGSIEQGRGHQEGIGCQVRRHRGDPKIIYCIIIFCVDGRSLSINRVCRAAASAAWLCCGYPCYNVLCKSFSPLAARGLKLLVTCS